MSTDRHEYRDMLGVEPYHLEDTMNMTTCSACGRPAKMWGHDGKCPDCIAATSSFGQGEPAITSPTYVHADCGCDYRDGEQIRWCAHHVSGMQETIRARDRSIAEYSTKVRVLEAEVATRDRLIENITAERDEAQRVQQHYIYEAAAEKMGQGGPVEEAYLEYKLAFEAEQRRDTHWCCMHMRWETPKGESA